MRRWRGPAAGVRRRRRRRWTGRRTEAARRQLRAAQTPLQPQTRPPHAPAGRSDGRQAGKWWRRRHCRQRQEGIGRTATDRRRWRTVTTLLGLRPPTPATPGERGLLLPVAASAAGCRAPGPGRPRRRRGWGGSERVWATRAGWEREACKSDSGRKNASPAMPGEDASTTPAASAAHASISDARSAAKSVVNRPCEWASVAATSGTFTSCTMTLSRASAAGVTTPRAAAGEWGGGGGGRGCSGRTHGGSLSITPQQHAARGQLGGWIR